MDGSSHGLTPQGRRGQGGVATSGAPSPALCVKPNALTLARLGECGLQGLVAAHDGFGKFGGKDQDGARFRDALLWDSATAFGFRWSFGPPFPLQALRLGHH